jgi:hypothetical protein
LLTEAIDSSQNKILFLRVCLQVKPDETSSREYFSTALFLSSKNGG